MRLTATAQDQNREERGSQQQETNRGRQEPQRQQSQPQQRAKEQQRGQEQRTQEQQQPPAQEQQQPRQQRQPWAQEQPRQPQQRERQTDQQRGQERQPAQEGQRQRGAEPGARPSPQEQARQNGRHDGQTSGRQARGGAPRAQDLQSARRVPRSDEGNVFAENRARDWRSEHQDWGERGGYRGYRIPEAQFNAYFGPRHLFRIYDLPLDYVGGYPEFNYNGTWFTLLDPVPDDWASDWYETDQVYVNFDPSSGGYYLYDTRYSDAALAVEPTAD